MAILITSYCSVVVVQVPCYTHCCSRELGVYRSTIMVKVAVKWNKRVFEDVEVAPNVVEFKAKLQELTVSKIAFGHLQKHP